MEGGLQLTAGGTRGGGASDGSMPPALHHVCHSTAPPRCPVASAKTGPPGQLQDCLGHCVTPGDLDPRPSQGCLPGRLRTQVVQLQGQGLEGLPVGGPQIGGSGAEQGSPTGGVAEGHGVTAGPVPVVGQDGDLILRVPPHAGQDGRAQVPRDGDLRRGGTGCPPRGAVSTRWGPARATCRPMSPGCSMGV